MSSPTNKNAFAASSKKVRSFGQLKRPASEGQREAPTNPEEKAKDDERRRNLFRSSSHRVLSTRALQNQQLSPQSKSARRGSMVGRAQSASTRRGSMGRSQSSRFGVLNDKEAPTIDRRGQLQKTKSGRVLQYPSSLYFEAPKSGMDDSIRSDSSSSSDESSSIDESRMTADNANDKSLRDDFSIHGDFFQDEDKEKHDSKRDSINSWDSKAQTSFKGGTFCNPSTLYHGHLFNDSIKSSDHGDNLMSDLGGNQPGRYAARPKRLSAMQEHIKNFQRQTVKQLGLPTTAQSTTTDPQQATFSERYFSRRNDFDHVDQTFNLMDSSHLLDEPESIWQRRRTSHRTTPYRNSSYNKWNQDHSKSTSPTSLNRWFFNWWGANKENQVDKKMPAKSPTTIPHATPSLWDTHGQDNNIMSFATNNGTSIPPPTPRRNTLLSYCCFSCQAMSRKRLCLLLVVAFGVLATAIAVHITVHNKRAASNNKNSLKGMVATIDHRDAIVEVLIQRNVTNLRSINKDQHPASKALEWLVEQQEKDASSEHSTPAQRHSEWLSQFALATLYYATNSKTNSWAKDNNWLTSKHFCEWHGVTCQAPASSNSEVHHVTQLNLTRNQLQGVLPVELKALTDLRVLDLSNNDLKGPILGDWTLAWKKLQSWRCQDNQFTGRLPSSWQMPQLQELHLSNNELRGTLPSSFSGNQDSSLMKVLYLHDNQFTGTLPSTMTRWTDMRYLHLHKNQLEGTVPPGIKSLTRLEELSLQDNNFVGKLPSTIGSLTKLEMLRLGNNDFRGPLPEMFTDLVELTDLQLHGNRFRSSLPTSIGGLSKLQWLAIESSGMTGPIPLSWNGLSNLEILLAHDNDLAGSLSATFVGRLTKLHQLSLHTNFLLGSIPSEIGLLSSLKGLFLESNDFRGTLPEEIGNLDNLETLKISQNHLTGMVPKEICHLRNDNNNNRLAALETDCNTGIKCDCCTACM